MGNKLASAKDVFWSGFFSLGLNPLSFIFILAWVTSGAPLKSIPLPWILVATGVLVFGVPLVFVYFTIKFWIKRNAYKAECREMNVRPERIAVIGGVIGFVATLSLVIAMGLIFFKISWPWIKEQLHDPVGGGSWHYPSEAGGWETPRQNPEKPTKKRDSARASDPGSN